MDALTFRFFRFALALGGAMLIPFAVFTTNAEAQSATCTHLHAQFASLGSGNNRSTSTTLRRYQKAVLAQKKQIRKIDRTMANLGCRQRKRFFQRSTHPRCTSLRSTRRRMESNLANLDRKTKSLGGRRAGRSNAQERRRVKRAIARAGCDSRQSLSAKSARLKREMRRLTARSKAQYTSNRGPFGTYKTLCVRTCDGYFFPVSYSTKPRFFGRDENACNNLCPGTEMKLYYHKPLEETSSDMVSAREGKPYSALQNAGAFRKSFNPSCACKFSASNQTNASIRPARKPIWATVAKTGYSLPVFRSRKAHSKPQQVASLLQLRSSIASAPVELFKLRPAPKVRIIGERFFPVR